MNEEAVTDYKRHKFAKGEVILKEGDQGEFTYLILQGKVDIRKGHFGDNPVTLATLGPGNVIGELSLFDGTAHMATVVAAENTEASAMSRDEFMRLIDSMDPVMKGIVGMMVSRLRQVVRELLSDKGDINWADWKK